MLVSKKLIWLLIFVLLIIGSLAYTIFMAYSEHKTLVKAVDNMGTQIQSLDTSVNEVLVNYKRITESSVKTLTVTAYTPNKKETDNDPYVNASMQKVRPGTVAVSRDLFDAGWVFGKKVYIEGQGIHEIADLMNNRYDSRMDVFMWDKQKAKAFGKQELRVALLEIQS